MATLSQTITPRTKCQRNASRWPIKDISSVSGSFLPRMRLKKDFLSDDDVANLLIWMAKVKYYCVIRPLQVFLHCRCVSVCPSPAFRLSMLCRMI